jgi:hypothetical protein
MKLADFLKNDPRSNAQFAEDIEVPRQTLHRYLKGEHLPTREIMARIVRQTNGAVTPNDFYPDLAGVGRRPAVSRRSARP